MGKKATRPYNDMDAEKVLACVRSGLSITAACERARVGSSDFFWWRRSDVGLRSRTSVALAEGQQKKQEQRSQDGLPRRTREPRRLSEQERLRQYMEAQKRAGRTHYFVLTLDGRRCAHCGRSQAGAMPGYCEPQSGVFTTGTAGWLAAMEKVR